MYSPLLALFFSAAALATSADTTDLATPIVKTETSYLTVTASAVVVVVTSTMPSYEEAMSIYDSEVEALSPTYPGWVESVLETAIPTTWKEMMMNDPLFLDSVNDAEASGILPAWYSSLPSDVKYVITSDEAVYNSEVATISVPSFVVATPTTTPSSPITSSSPSSSTVMSNTTSDLTATTSKSPETSTSTGGAPVATGGLAKGIAGAVGIFGFALAL